MNDILEYGLVGAGLIGLMIGLVFLYLIVCILLGLTIEMILGWMGHDVNEWYWTGVGLVALLGAVMTTAVSSKSD